MELSDCRTITCQIVYKLIQIHIVNHVPYMQPYGIMQMCIIGLQLVCFTSNHQHIDQQLIIILNLLLTMNSIT